MQITLDNPMRPLPAVRSGQGATRHGARVIKGRDDPKLRAGRLARPPHVNDMFMPNVELENGRSV
jgi:hypothetical protein